MGWAGAVGADNGEFSVVHEVGVHRDDRIVLGQSAEEADPTLSCRHQERLFLCRPRCGRGHHGVRPPAVSQLEDRVNDIRVGDHVDVYVNHTIG